MFSLMSVGLRFSKVHYIWYKRLWFPVESRDSIITRKPAQSKTLEICKIFDIYDEITII